MNRLFSGFIIFIARIVLIRIRLGLHFAPVTRCSLEEDCDFFNLAVTCAEQNQQVHGTVLSCEIGDRAGRPVNGNMEHLFCTTFLKVFS